MKNELTKNEGGKNRKKEEARKNKNGMETNLTLVGRCFGRSPLPLHAIAIFSFLFYLVSSREGPLIKSGYSETDSIKIEINGK